jgi:hypothetical protein
VAWFTLHSCLPNSPGRWRRGHDCSPCRPLLFIVPSCRPRPYSAIDGIGSVHKSSVDYYIAFIEPGEWFFLSSATGSLNHLPYRYDLAKEERDAGGWQAFGREGGTQRAVHEQRPEEVRDDLHVLRTAQSVLRTAQSVLHTAQSVLRTAQSVLRTAQSVLRTAQSEAQILS